MKTVRMIHKLYIKNMVCPRCITSVELMFDGLDIAYSSIKLGEVDVLEELADEKKLALESVLNVAGFELLQDSKSKIIGQIKSIIINQIHYSKEELKVNFSTLLSNKLHQEYSSMSKLFSSVEGVTIERYILKQKIERVKELLFYNEMTLSEIAYSMNYSSVAHLSAQFKKETGMTPTAFKKLRKADHKSLDSI